MTLPLVVGKAFTGSKDLLKQYSTKHTAGEFQMVLFLPPMI